MRGLRLWKPAVGFLLGGMDEVGKLDRVLDEKHRNVVSDNVPVALLCVELDREAAYIAREIGRSFIARQSRKADEGRRFFSGPLEESGLGNGRKRLLVLEVSMDSEATRMNDSLGNAFVIEVKDLLAKMKIFQQCRTA